MFCTGDVPRVVDGILLARGVGFHEGERHKVSHG